MLQHPLAALAIGATTVAVGLVGIRAWLLLWHNEIVARLSGTHFAPAESGFPSRTFDLLAQVASRPKGTTFVGMTPRRRLLGLRWEPVYLTGRQRSMHRHVVGKTGSGKTKSVLFPQVLQDALDGKGVLVMDAKGSDETVLTMRAIAAAAGRTHQLRVFSLPAWNQPQLPTCTYNMVYVRPRTPTDPGGDPVAAAERVFGVLGLGDNTYYNTQAQICWTNLCRLLHGMVDARGYGLPFVMEDLAVCFKGIGSSATGIGQALEHCLTFSLDRRAANEVRSQIARLGPEVHKVFSGIVGGIDQFLAPMVNAYAPDLILEDVLERNQLVYVQLPANLFPIQAPAMGRVILRDVQQEGSQRQVFRRRRNQRPFSVTVDEFYNFADLQIIDSLNKLRDAHLEYTLAHQSVADLELVSREFATAVWDNTRTKDILSQDNPELCEKVSKSIGTCSVVEKTVRRERGALFTSLSTGDASTRLVETYKLHPNQIKGLGSVGQGYLYSLGTLEPICYATLPATFEAGVDDPLPTRSQRGVPGLRLYERFCEEDRRPVGGETEREAEAARSRSKAPPPRSRSIPADLREPGALWASSPAPVAVSRFAARPAAKKGGRR